MFGKKKLAAALSKHLRLFSIPIHGTLTSGLSIMPLDREEYVEQVYFFRTLRERMQQSMSTQDLLAADPPGNPRHDQPALRHRLHVERAAADRRLCHRHGPAAPLFHRRFRPSWSPRPSGPEGRFDFRIGLEILEREAEYRAEGASPQGIFLYQFETLCRNRLGYDRGLEAMAGDEIYNDDWREWILTVRRQIGLVDFSDMIYVRSELYRQTRGEAEKPILFGEKEGRIALANRQKDPLYLFAALARHLGYPSVPRPA